MTWLPGIGPEISESVKEIYTAAGVRIQRSGDLNGWGAHSMAGSHRVGGGQRRADPEERQDGHPGCCYQLRQEEHRCAEGSSCHA